MSDFLYQHRSLITKLFEIFAAIFGSWYLKKTKNENLKIFVYYLWLVVVVEVLGYYKHILQLDYDYEWFIAWKKSVFYQNIWLYNIYAFFKIGLLGVFYSSLLTSRFFKLIIRGIVILYSVFSVMYYTFTDAFFVIGLPYDFVLGSVIVFIYVMFYFVELMNSEFILQYYKLPSFYISIALLLWHLCATPLFIFHGYFRAINSEFVTFRSLFLLYINIFTYSCFAFGFWYSLRKSKQ